MVLKTKTKLFLFTEHLMHQNGKRLVEKIITIVNYSFILSLWIMRFRFNPLYYVMNTLIKSSVRLLVLDCACYFKDQTNLNVLKRECLDNSVVNILT